MVKYELLIIVNYVSLVVITHSMKYFDKIITQITQIAMYQLQIKQTTFVFLDMCVFPDLRHRITNSVHSD